MKILVLSFYYTPDLSAGSFRTAALVKELQKQLGPDDTIDIVTTLPNRYQQFKQDAPQHETNGNINIYRIRLSSHKSGFIDQSVSYLFYSFNALRYVRKKKYDLIYATSGRLFTGFLAGMIARSKKLPLYLDIRDIFVDTMKSLLKGLVRAVFIPFFSLVEKFTFRSAKKINIVSRGFEEYISTKAPGVALSFFTNGIDEEFIDQSFSQEKEVEDSKSRTKVITYAGNIGQGQGLEQIIPGMAVKLGSQYEIRIIGDGGGRAALEKFLLDAGVNNVKLIAPVNRAKLVEYYAQSDYLFLHLNDVPAFEKVLPSKIFEYAVTGKPIIAGVNGYARRFIQENVSGAMLFAPCNVEDFYQQFQGFDPDNIDREEFCTAYARLHIMKNMATDILATLKHQSCANKTHNPVV